MGISVEQYRSRIGSHDNFLKTNYALSRFKDRFWNILQRMFYMNVFYLPTLKQAVGQYNIWNEWSLVYPIYVLQCLHAIVDTMSIIRKPQRFWYLKSYDTIMNYPVHWTLLSLNYLPVYYSWNLLWDDTLGAFRWGDLGHDQWSKITRMVHQRNQWIRDQRGFISFFDAPVILDHWSWSR